MKKYIRITLIILGVIVGGIGILIFSFVQEMKPDRDKEEEVRIQAEEYLESNYKNVDSEIYDILYDNMGNFSEFEYAAKVRDKSSNINFLVYYDNEKNRMVDTYIADKWADDLEKEIKPYIKENFGKSTDCFVLYERAENFEPNNNEITIRITIPRKKSDGDEELFNEFITFLNHKDLLKQGSVVVEYVSEKGEILEDTEWRKAF